MDRKGKIYKLMGDRADAAILHIMLAYHLAPRGGPIEALIDLLNGVYGLRQQLTASPRVLAIMTGLDQALVPVRAIFSLITVPLSRPISRTQRWRCAMPALSWRSDGSALI